RIPLPYWAIETRDDEPFLEGVAWKYFLQAIEWARKYGLRINVDLHALPGSQNGWNHSGRLGSINVLNGVMGIANAQRSLTYIRIIAEFISQPQYKDVVPLFGVVNEPQASIVGQPQLQSFYIQIYETIRNIGVGAGNGPIISYHDGFIGLANWAGWLPNADRVAMDTHPYFAFAGQSNAPISSYGPSACTAWGPMMNDSWTNIGITAAGEFSLATNDCGLFVNGVGLGTRYEGNFTGGPTDAVGSCEQWDDWESWTPDTKSQLMSFALASMDSLQNWFFWTWKIGASSVYGSVRAPFWSYSLGLQQGWIPTDPRKSAGSCAVADPYVGPPQSWQTGGSGANQIPATATAQFVFPPAQISNAGADGSLLPTYTPTGKVMTLPVSTITASATKTANPGSGWTNTQDTMGAYVAIPGCSYPDPWSGVGAAVPTAACGAAAKKREPVLAVVTPLT
ncbi:glycoside hydrolase family 5 protein, partial [Sphaerobolus stellatus SS14]